MAVLGPVVGLIGSNPAYIDGNLSAAINIAGSRQGYFFNYARTDANQYTASAVAAVYQTTGTRSFFVDETGVIRVAGGNLPSTWRYLTGWPACENGTLVYLTPILRIA